MFVEFRTREVIASGGGSSPGYLGLGHAIMPNQFTVIQATIGVLFLLGCAPLPVTVVNPTPLSVTVANPGDIAKAEGIQRPYQAWGDCNYGKPTPGACNFTVTTPPAQRIVIEFASALCVMGADQVIDMSISTTVADQTAVHHMEGSPGPNGFTRVVKLYADPSTTILFNSVSRNTSNKTSFCSFSLSGQAVSVL